MKNKIYKRGFTLLEVLVTIAIIGILSSLILVAFSRARGKSQDTRLVNDIRQIKWLAEIAYDSQGHTFVGWTGVPGIQDDLLASLADIDDALGVSGQTIMVDTENQDYCISAPLLSAPGRYYCTDRGSGVKIVSDACPVLPPVLCPS